MPTLASHSKMGKKDGEEMGQRGRKSNKDLPARGLQGSPPATHRTLASTRPASLRRWHCQCSARADMLTIERIFAAPDLSGASLRSPQLSPDGRYVAYLRGRRAQQGSARSLGVRHRARRSTRCWWIPRGSFRRSAPLSAEEEAAARAATHLVAVRNPRIRILAGLAFAARAARRRSVRVRPAREAGKPPYGASRSTESFETDAHFSPRGRYVSFIRDQNLFVYDLDKRQGARHHAGRRRARQLRHGGVHRAGGDGSQHRLLVVAG